jgi:hypothetical protein
MIDTTAYRITKTNAMKITEASFPTSKTPGTNGKKTTGTRKAVNNAATVVIFDTVDEKKECRIGGLVFHENVSFSSTNFRY